MAKPNFLCFTYFLYLARNFDIEANMNLRFLLILFISLSFTACVSTKKYKLLEYENLEKDSRIQKLELEYEKAKVLEQEFNQQSKDLNQTEDLLLALNAKYTGLQESYKLLQESYDDVVLTNAELLDVTSKEKSILNDQIQKKEIELEQKELLLQERQDKIQETEAKISDLEQLLSEEKLRMDTLQTSISNALFVFGPADLSVIQKNGKIYVSLSQKLLFSKGSDQIDSKGKNALQKLAVVLKTRDDIDILVEGHTDPDGNAENNWDLSTKRATSVVKLLQNEGVNPSHLTASGRALYDPIAENDTEANKSKNRRTEIILSPKLDQILELIRGN